MRSYNENNAPGGTTPFHNTIVRKAKFYSTETIKKKWKSTGKMHLTCVLGRECRTSFTSRRKRVLARNQEAKQLHTLNLPTTNNATEKWTGFCFLSSLSMSHIESKKINENGNSLASFLFHCSSRFLSLCISSVMVLNRTKASKQQRTTPTSTMSTSCTYPLFLGWRCCSL